MQSSPGGMHFRGMHFRGMPFRGMPAVRHGVRGRQAWLCCVLTSQASLCGCVVVVQEVRTADVQTHQNLAMCLYRGRVAPTKYHNPSINALNYDV